MRHSDRGKHWVYHATVQFCMQTTTFLKRETVDCLVRVLLRNKKLSQLRIP
jgi:hypothetical protein